MLKELIESLNTYKGKIVRVNIIQNQVFRGIYLGTKLYDEELVVKKGIFFFGKLDDKRGKITVMNLLDMPNQLIPYVEVKNTKTTKEFSEMVRQFYNLNEKRALQTSKNPTNFDWDTILTDMDGVYDYLDIRVNNKSAHVYSTGNHYVLSEALPFSDTLFPKKQEMIKILTDLNAVYVSTIKEEGKESSKGLWYPIGRQIGDLKKVEHYLDISELKSSDENAVTVYRSIFSSTMYSNTFIVRNRLALETFLYSHFLELPDIKKTKTKLSLNVLRNNKYYSIRVKNTKIGYDFEIVGEYNKVSDLGDKIDKEEFPYYGKLSQNFRVPSSIAISYQDVQFGLTKGHFKDLNKKSITYITNPDLFHNYILEKIEKDNILEGMRTKGEINSVVCRVFNDENWLK